MKEDPMYPYYLSYLSDILQKGRLSSGSFSLMKISGSSFDDFKYRCENEKLFNSEIIEIHKAETRDKKIDDIFDEFN